MRRQGGSALLLTLVLVPVLVLGLGLAVDAGRAVYGRLRLQWAADAGALAGAATRSVITDRQGRDVAVSLDAARARAAALSAFAANAPPAARASVRVDPAALTVAVTAQAEVSRFFLPLAGTGRLQAVGAQARAGVRPVTHKVSLEQ